MNRREFIKATAGAAMLGLPEWSRGAVESHPVSSTSPSGNAARPNILWVLGDDLGPDLACYDTPLVKTPNSDRLAKEGIRFARAYTTAPVCSPSRSALITGMYQTSIGAHNHRSHRNDGYTLPEGIKPVTDCFRAAGYFTCNVVDKEIGGNGKTDFNFSAPKAFDGSHWRQRRPDQPFFAQLTIKEPHRAFQPDQADPIDPDQVKLPPYVPDDPVARKDQALYLEMVQQFDRKLGRVLKQLEEDKLADNTIVFVFGDNGRCHVRDKQFLYDGGIHVPLIIRWPGHSRGGQIREDLVSAIDVTATSLALAGADVPKHMQGQVFLGPGARERKYLFAARDRCDETIDRIRSVQTTRYRHIRNFMPDRPYMQPNAYKEKSYPVWNLLKKLKAEGKLTPEQQFFTADRRPPEELYDLQSDPHEVKNLVDSPQHADMLKELRGALNKWIEDTKDQGAVPEPPPAQTRPR